MIKLNTRWLITQKIIALLDIVMFFSSHPQVLVTNGQKSLTLCHPAESSPSNASRAEPFSVFGYAYHIPMWPLFMMNRLHSLLSYVWYFTEGYRTSTSARKVSKSDWKQLHYITYAYGVNSANTHCSAYDPLWHLLHYLLFMNNELNITTTQTSM